MGFLHDIDGVGAGLDTFQLDFSHVLSPGSWIQVVTFDNIDTAKPWSWLILAVLQGEMEEIFKDGAESEHHSDLDGTNATDLLLCISIDSHWV